MKYVKLSVLAAVMLWFGPGSVGAAVDAEKLVRTLAEIGEKVQSFPNSETKKSRNSASVKKLKGLLQTVRSAERTLPPRYAVSLTFYKVWCYRLLEKRKKAIATIKAGLQTPADLPDLIKLRCRMVEAQYKRPERRPKNVSKRLEKWRHELRRILPLRHYKGVRSVQKNPDKLSRLRLGGGHNPIIPNYIGKRLPSLGEPSDDAFERNEFLKIPRLYEEMGYLCKAINGYLESLYSEAVRSANGKTTREIRTSIWLRIGKLESQLGHYGLAFRAYLRAAYTDASALSKATEGVSQSLNERPQSQPPKPKLDTEKMKAIARHYKNMNIHPLALSVLEKIEKQTDAEVGKLKKQVRKEWHKIIHIYQDGWSGRGRKWFFYGHKASEVGDWTEVQIMRPSDTFWKPVNNTEKE